MRDADGHRLPRPLGSWAAPSSQSIGPCSCFRRRCPEVLARNPRRLAARAPKPRPRGAALRISFGSALCRLARVRALRREAGVRYRRAGALANAEADGDALSRSRSGVSAARRAATSHVLAAARRSHDVVGSFCESCVLGGKTSRPWVGGGRVDRAASAVEAADPAGRDASHAPAVAGCGHEWEETLDMARSCGREVAASSQVASLPRSMRSPPPMGGAKRRSFAVAGRGGRATWKWWAHDQLSLSHRGVARP